ncbi:MAG: hypothetical protein U9N87_00480 [Planctomycetota bacterium]|nr:hypothetical protein [Planctomycetota bacterium]
MGGLFWVIVAGGLAALAGLLISRRSPISAAWRRNRFIEACRSFHWQREHLEARFVHISQLHCKPGSPRWADCDFSDDVSYVRNRYTGELSAFVAVTILLDVPQVMHDEESMQDDDIVYGDGYSYDDECEHNTMDLGTTVREATAVFRFGRERWETDGRAVFNLSPSETIRFYQHDLEVVGQELARHR